MVANYCPVSQLLRLQSVSGVVLGRGREMNRDKEPACTIVLDAAAGRFALSRVDDDDVEDARTGVKTVGP